MGARSRSPILVLVVAWLCGSCGGGGGAEPFTFHDACSETAPPDAACYADRRDPTSPRTARALEVALRYIDNHPPEEMRWNWEEGVLMFSMTELYRVTGDERLRDYYKAYIDRHLAEGWRVIWSDSCPPALSALALYEETGEERYAEVPRDVLDHVYERSLRTEEGGVSHLGTLPPANLWLDSLFMFGEVLTRWGESQDDARALDEVGEQIAIFGDSMQDESGWMVHAYRYPGEQDPGVFWARGNSWVTASMADYLRARRLRNERDRAVTEVFERQVAAIVETQDPATGLWWTVPNRPGETYLETSASAFFAYGLARAWRYGLLSDDVLPVVRRAVAGVEGTLVDDVDGRPVVTGISGPTGVGGFDNYAGIAVEDDVSYGVGAVILLLLESSGLPE